MYAIIQVGSAQFKIQEGDTIDAFRLEQEEGKNITLDQVLLYANGDDIRIGKPYLKDVKVTAKVLAHKLDDRRIAFKFRRRKGYSRKVGHRPRLTSLNITKISA
jgi:large subunit ribosomal protein L21